MARASKLTDPVDQEIYEVHRRYLEVFEGQRLATVSDETKKNYLKILKGLTDKLALPSKPLSEIVGEMMADAAPLLFQVMQK